MKERLRTLRESLNLSRASFGKKIGVSGDVINNLERGRVEIKEPFIKLICNEFNINYDWLANGIGSMYSVDENYEELIDKIMSSENEFAKNIFKTFAKFDNEDWEALKHIIERCSSLSSNSTEIDKINIQDFYNSIPDTPEELLEQHPSKKDDDDIA